MQVLKIPDYRIGHSEFEQTPVSSTQVSSYPNSSFGNAPKELATLMPGL